MELLGESVLDEYSKIGNPCFRVGMDGTYDEVSITPQCSKELVDRIFEAFEEFGFTKDCIKIGAVIGSSITPLSSDKSSIDVAIVTENNKLYEQVRNMLYSDGVIDSLVRSNSELSAINFNEYPDEEVMETLVYALRPHILKDCNKKKISEDVEMRVYYIIEPDMSFLGGENHLKVIDSGNRVAQYVNNKKVGYIDFLKDVNEKQHYKYVVKPLFGMFKDYRLVMNSLVEMGKVDEDHKDNLHNLRSAYDSIKNGRFSVDKTIVWKDHDGNAIEVGYNGRGLDYGSTYSYMNVLYHHISEDLMSPYGSDFTLRCLFSILSEDDVSEDDLKNFAKTSLSLFGKFDAGSFMSEKFERF